MEFDDFLDLVIQDKILSISATENAIPWKFIPGYDKSGNFHYQLIVPRWFLFLLGIDYRNIAFQYALVEYHLMILDSPAKTEHYRNLNQSIFLLSLMLHTPYKTKDCLNSIQYFFLFIGLYIFNFIYYYLEDTNERNHGPNRTNN